MSKKHAPQLQQMQPAMHSNRRMRIMIQMLLVLPMLPTHSMIPRLTAARPSEMVPCHMHVTRSPRVYVMELPFRPTQVPRKRRNTSRDTQRTTTMHPWRHRVRHLTLICLPIVMHGWKIPMMTSMWSATMPRTIIHLMLSTQAKLDL